MHGVLGDMQFLEAEGAFSTHLSPFPVRTYVDFQGVGDTHYSRATGRPPSGQPVGSHVWPLEFFTLPAPACRPTRGREFRPWVRGVTVGFRPTFTAWW